MFKKLFKSKNTFGLLAIIGIITVGLSGCGSSNKSQNSTSKVNAVGSTALQPLVEQASSDYQNNTKGVNINVQGGGSGTGLSQIQTGAVNIGNSDIFAQQQSGIKANELKDHQVAVVGMAPVVNSNSGVKNLSMDQLKKIFTGKITNWKEVGGKNQKITVINRAKGSGTRATFDKSVLGNKNAMNTQEQDSNGTVKKIVSSTPGTISYLAFSFINGAQDMRPISIDKVQPNDKNVENNHWKIWSYEHMYTGNKPNRATTNFIKYIQSKDVQNHLVKKLGYISIHQMQVQKDENGKVTKK